MADHHCERRDKTRGQSGVSPLREKGQDEGTESWERETGRLKGINAPTVAGQGRKKKIPPSVGDGSAVVLSASRIAGARAGHAVFAGARVELGARLQPAEAVRMRWAMEEGRATIRTGRWAVSEKEHGSDSRANRTTLHSTSYGLPVNIDGIWKRSVFVLFWPERRWWAKVALEYFCRPLSALTSAGASQSLHATESGP